MRALLSALLLIVVPVLSPALGQEIVSPEEFREYAEGHTIYFEQNGMPFGSEAFEEGGKVRWRFNDGSCVRGVWRARGAQLCFLYDMDSSGPLCWRMMRDEKGMFARLLEGLEAGLEIRVTGRDKVPLLCGEPGRNT